MSARTLMLPIFAVSMLALAPAHAYIGPGAGAGTIAVVLGILASIVMAFFALLWYPVKRVVKRFKAARADAGRDPDEAAEESGAGADSR
jgi:Kef-type K+ transport system membrane component KefB